MLAPLGAGGMGEVWRARDSRLNRDVAVKVLPESVSGDPKALARFESEAKAVAALSHPNILAIFDVGEAGGIHYAVTELLQGETLRAALEDGPVPVRRSLEIAEQIARGLSAAHETGLVHRDVKPENVFLTKDGHAKLLDFGLARHDVSKRDPSDTRSPTVTALSQAGSIVGTVAYMSPEQARGETVDFRSDQFSLGVVLYEMLAAKRPFQGESDTDVLASILRDEPEPLEKAAPKVPPPVRWIVERCLAKEPGERYASTRDLAREVATWRVHVSEAISGAAARPGPPKPIPKQALGRRLALASLGMALLAAVAIGFFIWGEHAGRPPVTSFKRITFRRGAVTFARFTPDFQSVVYDASWGGKPGELFVQRIASADARPLGVRGRVLGTAGGDVLVRRAGNILARLPLEGGTPRDLLTDVDEASWDRSGTRLAIIRVVGGRFQLEYPAGKVLLETTQLSSIDCAHLSPDGERIAFDYHPNRTDNAADICLVEKSGRKRTLSGGWPDMDDLAWSSDGKEVWFSASREGFPKEIHAVTLSGSERLVARFPGRIVLGDIAPDGRVLLSMGERSRMELRGRMAEDAAERDLSWLDGTMTPILSPDGTQMVFQEMGEGGGPASSVYYRRMDGSAPVRLGEGTPFAVSPDWKTILVGVGQGENTQLKLVPIGAGESVTLPRGPVRTYKWSSWHPGGKRIVIEGTDAEGDLRYFIQDLEGGLPRPFDRGDYVGPRTSDRRFIIVSPKPGAPLALLPIGGGEPRQLPFVKPEDEPIVFGDDGNSLFVRASLRGQFPIHVVRVDLRTGRRDPWLELSPPDAVGVVGGGIVSLTPNGRFYTYHVRRSASDLYVVEGLR